MKPKMFKRLLPVFLCATLPTFAAQPINLRHQSTAFLNSFSAVPNLKIEEVTRSVDFNNTLHVRFKQTYFGYPVWNGDGVLHIPNGGVSKEPIAGLITHGSTMNGVLYQSLDTDLQNISPQMLSQKQTQLANHAVKLYQEQIHQKANVKDLISTLMVYVDKEQKAHWAFKVQFDAPPSRAKGAPERPTFIIDALNFTVYKQWNDIKTGLKVSPGGGFGGNFKMGKMTYDGGYNHLPKLKIKRDAQHKICYLQNADVTVRDARNEFAVIQFPCETTDAKHNGVYWNADHDAINGAFSPANDALYEGDVIKQMYKTWYKVPVLEKAGKPMMLNMVVHENMENAYWDGKQMVFGDGDGMLLFLPLTSLDVAAHEISHGFTEQHANLTYEGQSGGMNESFSDMAAQAAYFFTEGRNNWKIGADITLFLIGDAIRYMDQPSKDCKSNLPLPGNSQCSIDDASQYTDDLDVHFSSGVYNRLFYLLATSAKWNTKKAFDVMVSANENYWTPNTDFNEGACGVIQATKDLGYDISTVKKAFAKVKVDFNDC